MLAQEPWCFHPEQIASLTDWQIEHLYARPAVERAKHYEEASGGAQRGERPVEHAQPTDTPEPGSPGFRDWVIVQFMKMGMTRSAAEAQYERQANSQ